jgi:hypothetical protein
VFVLQHALKLRSRFKNVNMRINGMQSRKRVKRIVVTDYWRSGAENFGSPNSEECHQKSQRGEKHETAYMGPHDRPPIQGQTRLREIGQTFYLEG